MIFASCCFSSEAVQKCFSFLACPKFLGFFNIRPERVDEILRSDFNCGYIAAISTVALVLLLFLLLRFVFWLIFRTKRCGSVVVPSENGDLIVTRNAVEAVVREEVESFPQIYLRKLLLFRRGNTYLLKLFCRFERGAEGMPDIAGRIRTRLNEVMLQQFGIDSIREVSICIERLKESDADGGHGADGADGDNPIDYSHAVSGF
ncbi:MAG: hypothetical protein IJU70_01085 [Lentisphaeria bacterium]|nr:hypothetical protein [Lentisphaeria bacterium]